MTNTNIIPLIIFSFFVQLTNLIASQQDTLNFETITKKNISNLEEKNQILSDSLATLNATIVKFESDFKTSAFQSLKNLNTVFTGFLTFFTTIALAILGANYLKAREIYKKLSEIEKKTNEEISNIEDKINQKLFETEYKIDEAKNLSDKLQNSVGYLKVLQDFYLRESFLKTVGLLKNHTLQINEINRQMKLPRIKSLITVDDLLKELEQRWAIAELFNPNTENHDSALDLLLELGNPKFVNNYLKEYIKRIDNDRLKDKAINILTNS